MSGEKGRQRWAPADRMEQQEELGKEHAPGLRGGGSHDGRVDLGHRLWHWKVLPRGLCSAYCPPPLPPTVTSV